MYKSPISFIIALVFSLSTFAIPARRTPFTVTQSDGSTLTLMLIGDETLHFLSTTDNIPVKEVNGAYFYATMSDSLCATSVLAHNLEQRTDTEMAFIENIRDGVQKAVASTWTSRVKARNARRIQKRVANTNAANARKTFGLPSTIKGEKKGIVILVNFANLKMKGTSTKEAFNNQFNQEGYNSNSHVGSVRDYFLDQSYGQLTIDFDVIGPVTLSKSYSYYGQNNSNGDDMHPGEMAAEACKLADKLGVDFTKYDWDGDKEVDQVFIIYAGYGEHYGASKSTIWPHEFTLSEAQETYDGNGPITLDGVKIDTYAASCELRGTSGANIDGIGTACHEFSHCFGLPDTYDTSYKGGFGMGDWDVLDSGSYNGSINSSVPSGYTAYERWFAGWLDLKELNSPCDVTDFKDLGTYPEAFIIYNDGNRDEYFILENRQNTKWFNYVNSIEGLTHGMLVTHVDYDSTAWVIDEVNNDASHQRMTIIPADKNYGTYRTTADGQGYYTSTQSQLEGDLFPGAKNITSLTNNSHYSCGGKLFNMNTDGSYYMNKPITEIKETDGKISFKFRGGAAASSINDNISSEKTESIFFNLRGEKIQGSPTSPGVYIRKQGDETNKIIIR